jgi:hypothetical protein
VPDVLLGTVGLRSLRTGMVGCLWALGGALLGGTVMYVWASRDLTGALAAVVAVPAISREMVDRVEQDLEDKGLPN